MILAMVLEDKHRVTKDTSARKNMTRPGTVSALEVKAIRASYDAYITSIKAGHEEIVDGLHSEHAEEISTVKKQSAIDITAVNAELAHEQYTTAAKQQAAATQATDKAEADNAELVALLRNKISGLEEDVETLRSSMKTDIRKYRHNAESAEQEMNQVKAQLEAVKQGHASELREMQARLAVGTKSWIQLNIYGKARRKTRTHWFRPNTKLSDAVKQMTSVVGAYTVRHGSSMGSLYDPKQTLKQVSQT